MKRRTFISLMSVMAAAGVLALAGCSSNSGSSAAASGAASSAASTGAADQLAAIQTNGNNNPKTFLIVSPPIIYMQFHNCFSETNVPIPDWP